MMIYHICWFGIILDIVGIAAKTFGGITIQQDESVTLFKSFLFRFLDRKKFCEPAQVQRNIVIVERISTNPVSFQPETGCHLRADTISIRADVRKYAYGVVLLQFFDEFFKHNDGFNREK